MIKNLSLLLLALLLALGACKHKTPEPVPTTPTPPPGSTTGTVPTPTNPPVNKVDSVCYAEQIQPLLSSNCAKSGCHDGNAGGSKAGVVLNNYNNVISTVSGNLLLQAVQDTGPLGMPPAPAERLSNQQIDLLKTWVQQGMQNGIDCLGVCDTVNLSFSRTIFPIFQNNCIGCHSTQSPQMTNYDQIKAQAANGKISCVLTGICTPMPPPPQVLSACNKKQIMKWIADGAPNN